MYEKKVREARYCMKSFVDEAVCEECDYYETCDHTSGVRENCNQSTGKAVAEETEKKWRFSMLVRIDYPKKK